MTRRRAQGKPIELFPFLAILASVVGVLTLLIAGLSLGSLEIDLSGTEFVRLQDQTAQARAEIERLERRGEGVQIQEARLRHMRAELARRERKGEEVRDLKLDLEGLEARRAGARAERDRLRRGLEDLQRELASLENELRGQRTQLGGGGVLIQGPKARPGQRPLAPRFVECRANDVVLDVDSTHGGPHTVVRTNVKWDERFRLLIQDVRNSSIGIVILLVREGGVETYDELVEYLTRHDVHFGALPVPGQKQIDFSALRGGR